MKTYRLVKRFFEISVPVGTEFQIGDHKGVYVSTEEIPLIVKGEEVGKSKFYLTDSLFDYLLKNKYLIEI